MPLRFRQLSLPNLGYPKIIKAENAPMQIAESRTALFNSIKCAGDEISQHITLFKEAYDINLEDEIDSYFVRRSSSNRERMLLI